MPIPPVGASAAAPALTPAAPAAPSFALLLESRAPLPSAPPFPTARSPALSALASVERAQSRLDAVLAAARSGRTFTAAELIGLQAEAYRSAQTVDLATKLVEQGAQSVKQAVNAQV